MNNAFVKCDKIVVAETIYHRSRETQTRGCYLSARITADQKEFVREYCKEHGTSESEMCNQILTFFQAFLNSDPLAMIEHRDDIAEFMAFKKYTKIHRGAS